MRIEGKIVWSSIPLRLVGLAVVLAAIAGTCVACQSERKATSTTQMGALQPGWDYGHSDINKKGWQGIASPEACSDMCDARPDCRAMTYVVSNKSCWLKCAVPSPKKEADMISAVKR